MLPGARSRTVSEPPSNRSSAETRGVRIVVESRHLPAQSLPHAQRFAFAYTVRIENRSDADVQLRARRWLITHGDGRVEEVQGPGVVGVQPVIRPRHAFEYTSGAILSTPRGSMEGSYTMVGADGEEFEAAIARFGLEVPYSLN